MTASLLAAGGLPAPSVVVVVPARDEEARIGVCLRALANQYNSHPSRVLVILVLDRCVDGTRRAAEQEAASLPGFRLWCADGPGLGVGPARALGLRMARTAVDTADPDALLATTDADSRVAPDWIAAQVAAVRRGARAIGGVIDLDEAEAALLPPGAVLARDGRVAGRLAAVREHAADAEHHQFSGASLSLTPETYDRVGGLPEVAVLEDEALEATLRRHGVPIAYLRAVRVTTSARLDGRVDGAGLAFALRALPA